MLNKPKFMKPSTNKEECTVDLTADKIPFSCIVDGNESVSAWQIIIYDITTNDVVFDSGKITLKSSFYPVDEKNRNVAFSVDLKNHIGNNATFVNRAEAYYWTITFWGTFGATTTSYQEVFYANKTPVVSFNLNDGDLLTGRSYTFRATYEQTDGVQLKRYGWKIIDTDNGQVLIDTITKNQIYGSADNIICSYDGFLNGSAYSVELYVETQNNAKITSSLNFSVSYVTTFLSSDFKVETLKNEPAIVLDWNRAVVIAGIMREEDNENNIVSIDDTTFKVNYPVDNQCSIEIPKEYVVAYDDEAGLNFDIDENSYIAFSAQLLSGDEAVLFSAKGLGKSDEGYYNINRELKYNNGVFTYTIIGQNEVRKSATYAVINRPSEYVWYNIFMSPLIDIGGGEYTTELIVYEGKVVNCIYPSENLYPREDFYPTFGSWDNLKSTSNGAGMEG